MILHRAAWEGERSTPRALPHHAQPSRRALSKTVERCPGQAPQRRPPPFCCAIPAHNLHNCRTICLVIHLKAFRSPFFGVPCINYPQEIRHRLLPACLPCVLLMPCPACLLFLPMPMPCPDCPLSYSLCIFALGHRLQLQLCVCVQTYAVVPLARFQSHRPFLRFTCPTPHMHAHTHVSTRHRSTLTNLRVFLPHLFPRGHKREI